MQAIKFELCGSNQFTKVDGMFQCQHCGTKYTLEEAKKLIISGTVEITKGDAEKERLLNNAIHFVSAKDFYSARDVFNTLLFEYPDDEIIMNEYKIFCCEEMYQKFNAIVDKFFCKVSSDRGYGIHMIVLDYMIQPIIAVGNSEYIKNIEKAYDKIFLDIANNKYTISQDDIICVLKGKYPYKNLRLFNLIEEGKSNAIIINKATSKYSDYTFEYHEVDFNDIFCICPEVFINRLLNTPCVIKHKNTMVVYAPFDNYVNASDLNQHIDSYTNYIDPSLSSLIEYRDIRISDGDRCSPYRINIDSIDSLCNVLSSRYDNAILIRKRKHLCTHCGGSFKGLFPKVCSKCGKPKDY